MDTNNKVQFKHALIENTNILVDIETVSNEDRCSNNYICPCCGEKLIPALGDKNIHHFRHKDGNVCDHNTYLHTLAELMFKQRFYSDKPLNIALPQIVKCSEEANKCILYSPGDLGEGVYNTMEFNNACSFRMQRICNLKDYYDVCTREKGINGYIADLLLEDSTGKHKPFLIEIFVTHECSEEKKNSGLRIFEIPIQDEQNVHNLITADCIHGVAYNFDFPVKIQKLNVRNILNKFVLYSNGTSHQENVEIKCLEFPHNYHKSKVLEFFSLLRQPVQSNYKKAQDLGYKVRTCHLCRYFHTGLLGENICSMKDSGGSPYSPRHIFANACEYFRCVYNIKSSETLKVTYIESDNTKKDCMSVYKRKYKDDVYKNIDEFISYFKAKKLCFKKLTDEETYFINVHFDTANRIIDDENLIYGIEFTSSINKCRILRIIFVRRNEFIRDIRSGIRTIYAYDGVIEKSDNSICINESKEDYFSNFVNFHVVQIGGVYNRLFEIKDSYKTLEETESAKEKAERLSAVRQKLEYAKNSFKRIFDEGKLMLAEIGQLPYELNSVYPICEDSSYPDALYFSLTFKRPKSYRADEITIRFVDRKTNTPGKDSNAKQIIIYIDNLGENVLEENCIYFKAGKIEYFDF